jgi:hypothetical protein
MQKQYLQKYGKYIPIVLIVLFSLALHAHWLFSWQGFWDSFGSRDAKKYHEMAWRFINEGIYGYNSEKSNAYVTPGQPFYLIITFKVAQWLGLWYVTLFKFVNMLLSVSTVALVFGIAYKLWKRIWLANFAAILYATYFTAVHFYRTYLTETPSIFFFMLSLFVLIIAFERANWKWHIAFGISASITLMFRPTPAPLLLLALGILIHKVGIKRAFNHALCWVVGPMLVIMPWIVRNEVQFHHAYVFSSHSGNPFLGGTNPYMLEDTQQIIKDAAASGIEDKEYGKMRIKEGLDTNFSLWASWYTVGKTIDLFVKPDQWYNYKSSFSKMKMEFMYNQHYFIVFSALLTMLFLRKSKEIKALIAVALIYVALSNMFIVELRYGFFLIPLLCVICAYGWFELFRQIKQGTPRLKAYVKNNILK